MLTGATYWQPDHLNEKKIEKKNMSNLQSLMFIGIRTRAHENFRAFN
jgi:hypothetical protein